MDEFELIAIGAVFATALTVNEFRIRGRLSRMCADGLLLCVVAIVLFTLHLSITHDAADFLAADFGIILVLGISDYGGLLPPALSAAL